MLDISSGSGNTLGLLIPRMTSAQRIGIGSLPQAAQGLMVYQTDNLQGIYYNTNTTTTPNWVYLNPDSWSLTGNAATNASTNFLGTTDAVDLVFKTSGIENLRIRNSNGFIGLNQPLPSQRLEIKDGNILISNSGTAGQLQFQSPSSGFISTFKAGVQSANIFYTLPTSQPSTPNLALVNDGSGNLSWNVPSPGNTFISSKDNLEDFLFQTYTGVNDNPYAFVSYTSGTGATSDIDGSVDAIGNDYFGLHILNSGTTSTGRAGLGAHNNINRLMLGGKEVIFETRVRIEALSTATQTFKTYYGLMDGILAGTPADGVYFTYSNIVNSGNWTAITKNSSGATTTINSTIPVVANQWYILRCDVNSTGTKVDFYVDDVLIGSSLTAANIPIGTGHQVKMVFKLEKSAGTSARTTSIDYVIMRMNR